MNRRRVLSIVLSTIILVFMLSSILNYEMKVYATVNVFDIVGVYDLGGGTVSVEVSVQFCDACNPNDAGNPGCDPFTHGYPPLYYPYSYPCGGVIDGRYVAVLLRDGPAQNGTLIAGPQKIICTPGNCPLEPASPTVLTFIFTGVPVGLGHEITVEADIYCSWCGHWFPTPKTLPVLARPVAKFTYSYKSQYEDHEVTFDASTSYHPDPKRKIVSYEWDFGDGKTGSGMTITHVYAESTPPKSPYNVVLTVTDDVGQKDNEIVEVVIGNLIATHIEAVQAPLSGVGLVQNKPTTFLIHYWSTFDEDLSNVEVRIDLEGFNKAVHTFRTTFLKKGFHYFYLHDVDLAARSFEFLPRTKPTVKYRITIDSSDSVKESFEDDNVWPKFGLTSHNVRDTRPIKILFVQVHYANEPIAVRITSVQTSTYMSQAMLFLGSTYPLAWGSEVNWELSPTPLVLPAGTDWLGALESLRERTLTGVWPFRTYAYDRVVGVVSGWAGWDAANLFDGASGFTTLNGRSVMVKTLSEGSVAHEIGHTYGLGDDYPGGAVAEGTSVCRSWSGYWVVLRREIRDGPTFMHGRQPNRWVDDIDYNILLNKFDTRDPELLLINGLLFKNNTATFVGAQYHVSEGFEDIMKGGTGSYYIVLLDSVGNTLSRVGFNATFYVLTEPPIEVDESYFNFAICWVNGTRVIQLQDALGNILDTQTVSPNPPSVTVISPNGSEIFTPGTNYTITWSASDLDGDALTYSIHISWDKGSSWVPLETDLEQTSFTYDFSNLPGGNKYLIGVYVSDGVNVGGDTSDGLFTVTGCFIATAAYGTPMAEEIQILREFRDKYLLTNPVGRAFVDFYYRVSPPIAEFITERPSLKPIVRAGLVPAVAMSAIAVNTTPIEKAAIVGLLALVSVALAVWATRRRGRGPEHT